MLGDAPSASPHPKPPSASPHPKPPLGLPSPLTPRSPGNAVNQPPAFSFGLRQQLWALHSGSKHSCMPARCAKHNAHCPLDFDAMAQVWVS